MLYNGPPSKVPEYFSRFGMQIKKFSNPADKIIQLAAKIRSLVPHEKANFYDLAQSC
jgi:hypothetical protein